MNLNLVLSIIVHTFGRHSRTPRRTALRRLLAAYVFAGMLGAVITRSLSSLMLPSDLFQSWLTIMLILVVQIITGFIMLIVRASGYGLHDDQMNDILGILPVSEPARWILGLVPGLCAILMILVLSIGPLVVIARTMHLSWPLFIAGLGVGLTSGVGIGTYQPHRLLAVNFLLMIALVVTELQLLDRILTLYQIYENPFLIGFAALVSLILVPHYWIIRSMQTWTLSRQRRPTALMFIRRLPIGLASWMSAKILRHPKTLRSSIVLTGLSGGIAYLWLQSGGSHDPNISNVIMCLSFIASLAASDIRSLTRPHLK